jgi:PAS domain S-box-containing protein
VTALPAEPFKPDNLQRPGRDDKQTHSMLPPEAGALARFVDESPRGKAMFDTEMRYLAVSEPWCAKLNLERSALIGQNCYAVNPGSSEQWREMHRRCLAGAVEGDEQQVVVPANGRRTWTRWESRPWRTVAGNIGGIVVRFEDTTAKKEEQFALAEREHQLQITLDASDAGTWIIDARTSHVVSDRRSRLMFGLSADAEVTTVDVLGVIADEDRGRVVTMIGRLRQSADDHEWGEEFRVVRPDGGVRWISSHGRAERDHDGNLVRLLGINLDVTERKLAEEAARRSEQEARLALEASSAFAWSWDRDAGPWVVEPNIAAQMGVPAGQPFDAAAYLSRVHRDDRERVRSATEAVRADSGPAGWDLEYRLTHEDGREVWFHSRGSAVRDGQGRAHRFFGIMIDVTPRKTAELEVERAHVAMRQHAAELERRAVQLQRLASDLMLAEQHTRERLAKLLHDHLQQLLFSALMKVERATARAPELDLLGQVHSELKEAIEETRSLSVDLLPSTLRRGDLPGALTWLGGWILQKYGVAVDVTADPRANPTREEVRFLLYESIRELLFNAVKHASVARVDLRLAMDADDQLRITVTDAGVGFEPDMLASRPTIEGGLGLRGIGERLALFGGHMQIDSAPGQGARFPLLVARGPLKTTVPLDADALPGASVPIATGPGAGPRPLRILLVDDHATVRRALHEVLAEQAAFLIVGEAVDGVEAIEKARALAPDAIIMDVSMPRLDGLEATRRIHADLPQVRIFGLSTQEESERPHAIEDAGADGYFSKGVGLTRLVERLRMVHAEIGGR